MNIACVTTYYLPFHGISTAHAGCSDTPSGFTEEPPDPPLLEDIDSQLDWIVALCHRVAPHRSPLVQDAVQLHREGRYSGSVLILLLQIEALLALAQTNTPLVFGDRKKRQTILSGNDLRFDTRQNSVAALADLRSLLLNEQVH